MPEVMRTGMESYFTAFATLDCGLKNEYQPLTAMVWQQKIKLLFDHRRFFADCTIFHPAVQGKPPSLSSGGGDRG